MELLVKRNVDKVAEFDAKSYNLTVSGKVLFASEALL